MTENEFNKLVAGMTPVYRIILAEAAKGPVSGPRLREPTGRSDGMTAELRKLRALGLIRDVGFDEEATTPGVKPRLYARVPLADMEAAAAEFAKRRARAKKRKSRPGVAEKPERVRGKPSLAILVRRNTLMLAEHFRKISSEMVFWDEATHEDLVALVECMGEVTDAMADLAESLHERLDDDAARTKIAKLLETNGRTEHEIRSAQGLARKLERQRKATG
jgi:hypothetical protein